MSGEVVDWKVHPFRERPGLGWGVLAGIAAFSVLAGVWGHAWFWTAFCFLVLFLSLESFYFPTRFILEERRVVVVRRFSRSEREWGVFRRCLAGERAITLSPFAKPSWLEAYRAIRLHFGAEDRTAIVALLRQRLGPEVEWIQDRQWERKRKGA